MLNDLLVKLRPVIEEAGREAMRFYDVPEATWKEDGSPVTAADTAAEKVILPALRQLTPDIPVISEEEAAAGISPEVRGGSFWLVDPLDGTKEFIKKNGEFTVNIALIENGVPILGLVHSPVYRRHLYCCRSRHGEACPWRWRSQVDRRAPAAG